MCFWLVHTQTFHEPAVLLRSQAPCFTFLPRPLERTGLQALVQQDKSVSFPVQCLYPVPASAAEEEEGIGERIQVELLLDKYSQSVYSAAKVGVTAGDIHPVGPGKIC